MMEFQTKTVGQHAPCIPEAAQNPYRGRKEMCRTSGLVVEQSQSAECHCNAVLIALFDDEVITD